MSIAALGYSNSVVLGQLSAGSAVLPVVNLANQLGSPATAWQTVSGVITSAAGAWIRGNSALFNTNFGAFGLFRTNLTGSAYMRARVWSDYYATLVYDSGSLPMNVLPGIGQAIILPGTTVVGQYWQIDIDDVGNPDGFLNVPLAYVGPLFSPTVGMTTNSQFQTVIGNVSSTTKYGQVYVASYWQARQANPSFGYITDAEMSSMLSLDTVARTGQNVLFIPDTTGTGYLMRDAVFGVCTSGAYGYSYSHRNARSWAGQILERL